ncbi:dTDP-4-dehydrorhamnose reductase [Flavobacterium sp.]|uniref:dTDP-4-dehydrorhamnose reductase n=1 Tax=Flavobacterium sp. TaxID=239 RepID=UPI003A8E43D1
MVVLVTGASGQLGQSIKHIAASHSSLSFYYADSKEGDITNKATLEKLFKEVKPDYCINAAAYTAVDKAETDKEQAYAVNVTGAKNLAEVCNARGVKLIHISTDFVFDGTKSTPYTEEDITNPQGVYGLTKRQGEQEIENALKEHYIVRTSWLYSQFANNFMKTMLRLAAERDSLGVIDDQKGTPTNAVDLAEAMLKIIESGKAAYGIYHYSNEGETSWYGFAKQIFETNNVNIDLKPIPTSAYPTPAKRPQYSVLDKSKIKDTFDLQINNWQDSLQPYN